MTSLHDNMERLSRALMDSVTATGAIDHRLTKGELREDIVRDQLRPYIPSRFAMTSGVIVNATGAQSKQQDIVLSDTMNEAPFISHGHMGVHPVEAVSAVIEVKSGAARKDILDGVAKVASVKRLLPAAPRTVGVADYRGIGEVMTSEPPFGGILCLGAAQGAAFNTFIEANLELPPAHRTNALVVIGEFVGVWCLTGPDSTDQMEVFPSAADKVCRMAYAEHSLLVFYALLREALRSYPQPRLELAPYVNAGIGTGQHEVLCRVLKDEERRTASPPPGSTEG